MEATPEEAPRLIREHTQAISKVTRALLDGYAALPSIAAGYAALSEALDNLRLCREDLERRGVMLQRAARERLTLSGVGSFEVKRKVDTKGFRRDDCVADVRRLLLDERHVDPDTGEVFDGDPRYGAWLLGRFLDVFRPEPRTTALRNLGLDPEDYYEVYKREGYAWRFDPADRFHKGGRDTMSDDIDTAERAGGEGDGDG